MINNVPLFENDIIATIVRNFRNSLTFEHWFYVFLSCLCLIYLFYCLLTKTQKTQTLYYCLFENQRYLFDKRNKWDWWSLIFPATSFIIMVFCVYSLDNTLFNNLDLMSANTIGVFDRGIIPPITLNNRFQPLSFQEMNFIYAISHNYNVINLFILTEVGIVAYLLYIWADFIPVTKRLLLLSCCIICPAFFWISNVIFCELTIFIYILLSLLAIKKFSHSQQPKYLWFFILFMNLAFYTKETVILFYFGILACSLLYNIFMGKINLQSFVHPWRTMKELPLESLMFFSMLIYCCLFLVFSAGIENNEYLKPRQSSLVAMLFFYKFEIIISVLASLICITRITKLKLKYNPMFKEGLQIGYWTIILMILFKLKLLPTLWHVEMKTYYMVIPAIFAMIYLFSQLRNKTIIGIITFTIIIYSLIMNYKIYQNEQGVYYHQVAEFMSSKIEQTKEIKIFLATNTETSQWGASNWSTAYKYYFPKAKIIIQSPNFSDESIAFLMKSHNAKLYGHLYAADEIQKGDYFIVKKSFKLNKDMELIKNMKNHQIYENKIFIIYEIQ